jgi:hypothetical protein
MSRMATLLPVTVPFLLFALSCSKPAQQQPTTADKAAADKAAAEKKSSEAEEPSQTYEEAWKIICDAQELSGVDPNSPRQAHQTDVVNWLVANLKNKKARFWWIEFGNVKEKRKEAFEAEAKRGGVEKCALSSMLFPEEAQPAPSPSAEKPDGNTAQPKSASEPKPRTKKSQPHR